MRGEMGAFFCELSEFFVSFVVNTFVNYCLGQVTFTIDQINNAAIRQFSNYFFEYREIKKF